MVQLAHCSSKLTYIIRKAPFNLARLKDKEMTIDFSSLTTEKDQVAIIATTPLTDNEEWHTIAPGTLLLFKEGEIIGQTETVAFVKPSSN